MTLISPETLAERLSDPRLRLVDVRWVLGRPGEGRRAYEDGHLPGAIHLDLDTDLAGPASEGPGRHPLPSPAAFAARMGAAGIGDEHQVVAYDDAGGWVAARLWWMLDKLGHRDVAVLDGGFGVWCAAERPISVEVPVLPPATLTPRGPAAGGVWPGTITRDELRERLGSLVLLDARAEARYRGEFEPIDPAAGHIPTARSAPFDGNLGPDGRFLPAEQLQQRFHRLGGDGPLEVVVSCGSGTSACHHSLAMRMAGMADPTLYVGSFSDWSRSGYPVATGPEPGDPPEG